MGFPFPQCPMFLPMKLNHENKSERRPLQDHHSMTTSSQNGWLLVDNKTPAVETMTKQACLLSEDIDGSRVPHNEAGLLDVLLSSEVCQHRSEVLQLLDTC